MLTATQIQEGYAAGTLTPTQVVQELVALIEAQEPKVKALTFLNKEGALEQAQALEAQGYNADQLLWGIPVFVKDNICVEGLPTTCASKILDGFQPPYDATVTQRLKAAGAIILGMANMDEFAFGSSCEHSAYQPTHNPWNLDCVPGGSSGGPAASVAAHFAPMSLGSDTGGSIRQPASFCGIVGLKPTYGRVSRYGLVAFGSSLDQIGPMTRSVRDNALLLQTIAGRDGHDATSAETPVPDYVGAIDALPEGLKVGVPKEYFVEGMDPEVTAAVEAALEQLKGLGVQIQEVSLPHTQYAVPTYYIVAPAEASSNLARFDGVKYGLRSTGEGAALQDMYMQTRDAGLGAEAKRRIILGTFVLSSGYYDAYYAQALKVRTLIKQDFDKALEQVDCLIAPTSPTTAFKLNDKLNDPVSMYLSDVLTISVNLAGVPSLSVPCGFSQDGLPIGMQIIGKPFDETLLFQVGHAYEQACDWVSREPALS